MNIEIMHLVEGAKNARGIAVVIDVFRAFSLAPYAFDAGVSKIIPVMETETAFKLKEENPDYILVGERNERKVPGFDYGNSPSHILEASLKGRVLVHTTSAGTRGLVNAMHADEVLTGSFVNASAIVRYLKKKAPENISLVCMGYGAEYPVEEDSFCAEYIKNELEGRNNNFAEYRSIIRNSSGKRFFEEAKQSFAPSSDFELCLDLNRFSFVLKAEKENGYIRLRRIDS